MTTTYIIYITGDSRLKNSEYTCNSPLALFNLAKIFCESNVSFEVWGIGGIIVPEELGWSRKSFGTWNCPVGNSSFEEANLA